MAEINNIFINMEPASPFRNRIRTNSAAIWSTFINSTKTIEHVEVYDNDKCLLLVGMDKGKALNVIIKFNRYRIELDYEVVDEIYSHDQVRKYIMEHLNWKKPEKYYKYRAYAIFGIYKFYKLTYIALVKGAKPVAKFLDAPVYEIKEVELFAIQAKKFYKENLGKKEVNIEREYK